MWRGSQSPQQLERAGFGNVANGEAPQTVKRRTKSDSATFERYICCRTTIYSPSDSSDRISSTSSSYSSILGIIELAVRFLFVFFVDTLGLGVLVNSESLYLLKVELISTTKPLVPFNA